MCRIGGKGIQEEVLGIGLIVEYNILFRWTGIAGDIAEPVWEVMR
jgi:hypothetical protein